MAKLATAVFGQENCHLDVATAIGLPLKIENVPAHQLAAQPAMKTFLDVFGKHPSVMATTAAIRLTQHSGIHINYSTPDGLIGKFDFTLQDPGRAQRALDALAEYFNVVEYVDHIKGRMDGGEQAALQMRERSVADLREEVGKLAAFLADLGQREAESRRKAQEDLEKDYRERQAKLEESAREREAAIEKRQREHEEAFAKRVRDQEVHEKKFKTHEAKYMRRELLERIDGVIGAMKTFAVSDETQKKRWIIHIFTGLLILSSGGIAASILVALLSSSPLELRLLFPLAAASATLVTTFVYYLKWNDRWFREHADNEFAAKQYQADILRASWVAELVSEWQTENGDGELPPELISAFTRHLFRDVGGTRENEHPLEAVTGMVKRVTSVTVGKGSISVRGDAGEDAPRKMPRHKRPKHDDAEHAEHDDEGAPSS